MSMHPRRGTAARSSLQASPDALPSDLRLALLGLPLLESLENRRLLAGATLAGSVITVTGETNAPNTIDVRVTLNKVRATVNGALTSFALKPGMSVVVEGGEMADTLTTAAVALPMTVNGRGGDDSLQGGVNVDTFDGGDGFDTADGLAGVDTGKNLEVTTAVELGQVGPISRVASGTVTVAANEATNVITVTLDAAAQNILIRCNANAATYRLADVQSLTITGGTGNDSITVADALTLPVTLRGGEGDDTLRGGGGNDLIEGNNGNDLIEGNAGNDWMYGGAGIDTLRGGAGDDGLDSGAGAEMSDGGAGSDLAVTGDGYIDVEFTAASLEPGVPVTPFPEPNPTQLTGVIIGTPGSYQSNGFTIEKAFDGNLSTYFDAPTGNNNWVGLDLGTARVIGEIKYAPRVNWTSRMNGGFFQGSNNANFSGAVVLATIKTTPTAGVLSSVSVTNTTAFRYLRYVAPANSYGNVCEIQFWSAAAATTPPVTTVPDNGITTPPVIGEAADPVAVITAATATTATVGQGVHFNALASTLNAGTVTSARFEWDFGDAGSAFNKLVGFNAAHAYETPGTYTVTLRVINEGGRIATTTASVTVAAAADARPVIYVAADGNDANDGATTGTAVRSFARATALLGKRDGVAVLFRRGDTFDLTSGMTISGDGVTLSAYGTGNRPVLRYAGTRSFTNSMIEVRPEAQDLIVRDLTFDSIFNTDTEQTGMPVALRLAGRNIVVRGNEFRNVGYAMNVTLEAGGLLSQENVAPLVTGIRGYFMWVEGSDIVAIGNTVANSTREHNIRVSGANRVLISGNNLANLDRRDADGIDTAKATVNLQKGGYFYVTGNTLNGPAQFGPLGIAANIAEKDTRTSYGVFDGNHVTGGKLIIYHGTEHLMVRSNVLDVDDDAAIDVQGYNPEWGRGVSDLSIINNTGINDGTRGHFLRTQAGVQGVRVLNNLYVAPTLWTGAYNSAPMSIWDPDLSGFTTINNNVWGDPNKYYTAEGGINWIGTANDASSYRTAAEWNDFSDVVGTDLFVDIALDGAYRAIGSGAAVTSGGIATGGIFTDYFGRYRDPTQWTIGAV